MKFLLQSLRILLVPYMLLALSTANADLIRIDPLVLAGGNLVSPSNTIGGDIHANGNVDISGDSLVTGDASATGTVTVSGASIVTGTQTAGAAPIMPPTFAELMTLLIDESIAFDIFSGNTTITSGMTGIILVDGNAAFSAFDGFATVIASGSINFGGNSTLVGALDSLESIFPNGLALYSEHDLALQGSVSGAVISRRNVNLATGSSVTVSVPEPGSLALFMIGIAPLLMVRRRLRPLYASK